MANVIFITRFAPAEVGHGGHHRSYQVAHDLQAAVGGGQVHVYVPPVDRTAVPLARGRRRSGWGLRQRLGLLKHFASARGNPYRLVAHILGKTFAGRRVFGQLSVNHYAAFLDSVPQPALCVIDYPGMDALITENRRRGLPTIACPQNLETFDRDALDPAQEWAQYAFIVDYVAEYKVLADCAERLFISRVEAGLIGGLGLSAHYYPYLPVGAIRERGLRLRGQRAATTPDQRLFLMLGSAAHETTREGFLWFAHQAQRTGLPPGARVVVAGLGTDKLLPPDAAVPGLELAGWLEQDALDDLLVRAQAVLVPQRRGFGTLTRLSELASAGVPAYVSAHAALALDLPPGVERVEDDWDAWRRRLQCPSAHDPDLATYEHWEAQQPQPLGSLLGKYLA